MKLVNILKKSPQKTRYAHINLEIYHIDLTAAYITFSGSIISFVQLQLNPVEFFFFRNIHFIDEKSVKVF